MVITESNSFNLVDVCLFSTFLLHHKVVAAVFTMEGGINNGVM